MQIYGSILLSLALILAATDTLPAQPPAATPTTEASQPRYWPQWRGPLANGTAPQANPPLIWSESKNVRWRIDLPGKGHSSPIIWSNRVYLLAATPIGSPKPPVHDKAPGVHDSVPVTHDHAYKVISIDRKTGGTVWEHTVRETFPHEGGHNTGSQASQSAITDGERIYANFGSRGLHALDLNGRPLWSRDLGRMLTLHAHGEGSSPAIHGDLLFVNWDHEGDSFIEAFETRTGKTRWRTTRDEKTSWSTPIVVESGGKWQVVVSATKKVRSYDVSTGRLIWECAGLTDNVVSSPVFHDGLVITGNSYYQQAMMGIRIQDASGDISGSDRVAWRVNRLTPYVSSPLLYHGALHFLRHNQNILIRMDPATGRHLTEPFRLDGIRDFIFSSPVAAAGRIYITGRDGKTVVVRADGPPEVLAVNSLQDSFSASAAIVDREIYLRGERYLYCLSEE